MRKAIRMLAVLAAAVCFTNLHEAEHTLKQVENSVIRLHVLADSDSLADQTNKLLVRDAILQKAGEWVPSGCGRDAAYAALNDALPEIQETAERTLREAGSSDAVSVRLEETDFPERSYGSITLPAGQYQALRVEIGTAAGQNWWCVMYPAMCIPASAEQTLTDTLDADACEMLTEPEHYELRLKCVDAWRAAVRWVKQQLG